MPKNPFRSPVCENIKDHVTMHVVN